MRSRSQATELLDSLSYSSAELARNLHEMAFLFRMAGGLQFGWQALKPLLCSSTVSMLDLGSGGGAHARFLTAQAHQLGTTLTPVLLDQNQPVAALAHKQTLFPTLVGAGSWLPLADQSVDLIWCAQVAHHCAAETLITLFQECQRCARIGGVIVDLQRSWLGYVGARLAALGPLTRLGKHDGPLSVQRAWQAAEVRSFAQAAGFSNYRLYATPIWWALQFQHEAVGTLSAKPVTQTPSAANMQQSF